MDLELHVALMNAFTIMEAEKRKRVTMMEEADRHAYGRSSGSTQTICLTTGAARRRPQHVSANAAAAVKDCWRAMRTLLAWIESQAP